MIIWAAVGLYHGTPPRECLSLSRRHLLSEKKRDSDADGPSYFLAVILFVLVPLPQILKIMASMGIFWTKIWAMAYFLVPPLTFPIVEQRSGGGGGGGSDRSRIPPSVRAKLVRLYDWLYKLTIAAYAIPWLYVVTRHTFKLGSESAHSWEWLYVLPICLLMVGFVGFAWPAMFAVLGAVAIDVVSRCVYRLRGERLPTIVWSEQWLKKVAQPGPWNGAVL